MHHRISFLAMTALLLAGCASQFVPVGQPAGVTLSLQPAVQAGGLRTLAADPAGLTQSDIDHVLLRLYTVDGTTETQVVRNSAPVELDVASSSLGATVQFQNLHANTDYRVRAFAYKAPSTATGDLISTDNSYVDVPVGTNQRPGVASIPIYLMGRLFNAQATSSFTVTPGGLTTGTPTLTLGASTSAPAPTASYATINLTGYSFPEGPYVDGQPSPTQEQMEYVINLGGNYDGCDIVNSANYDIDVMTGGWTGSGQAEMHDFTVPANSTYRLTWAAKKSYLIFYW